MDFRGRSAQELHNQVGRGAARDEAACVEASGPPSVRLRREGRRRRGMSALLHALGTSFRGPL
jgi:hypothetical protein